jgi:hypothetical protein
MSLAVSEYEPDNADLSVEFDGGYYTLLSESGYQWNHKSFRLLHQIFQMTTAELARQGAPVLTIAK